MRRLTNDDAVPPPERVLAEARRLLAEREGVEHDHGGDGPCPVCGGHRQADDSNEENE